jgi:YVTN family beta-propeller protein
MIGFRVSILLVTLQFLAAPGAAAASSPHVVATIGLGNEPAAVGVNPLKNRIYVVSNFSNTVLVMNGATNSVTATIAVGSDPNGLGVNPTTNTIYVANAGMATVTVIKC